MFVRIVCNGAYVNYFVTVVVFMLIIDHSWITMLLVIVKGESVSGVSVAVSVSYSVLFVR